MDDNGKGNRMERLLFHEVILYYLFPDNTHMCTCKCACATLEMFKLKKGNAFIIVINIRNSLRYAKDILPNTEYMLLSG